MFCPACTGCKSLTFTKCGQNAFDACIQQKYVLQYYYHKECARDSPFDRTATCFCKVPKAERWEKQIYSPSDDGLFCCLFVEYTWRFFMKQITVKVENQQQLAYLLDILRSKGYKNVQRLNKRYSFPVVVVDLDRKQFFGTNTTCMAALASQGKMCVITVEQLLAQRFFPATL